MTPPTRTPAGGPGGWLPAFASRAADRRCGRRRAGRRLLLAPALHTEGARISHLTIASRFVHGQMQLTLVTPAGGGAHRPLLVFLHGVIYTTIPSSPTSCSRRFTRSAHALRISFSPTATSPTVATAPTAHGGSYVLDEVIPKALAVLNADPRRVAIGRQVPRKRSAASNAASPVAFGDSAHTGDDHIAASPPRAPQADKPPHRHLRATLCLRAVAESRKQRQSLDVMT